MSDFDDPGLERILGRSGGPFPDVNLAYQQVQARVRRAKRRRPWQHRWKSWWKNRLLIWTKWTLRHSQKNSLMSALIWMTLQM